MVEFSTTDGRIQVENSTKRCASPRVLRPRNLFLIAENQPQDIFLLELRIENYGVGNNDNNRSSS